MVTILKLLAFLMLIMVCTTVADDYVSYWKFDENGTAYDENEFNNLTITNAVFTTGKNDGGYRFNGLDTNLKNLNAQWTITDEISICFWIYDYSRIDYAYIFTTEEAGGKLLSILHDNTGKLRFQIYGLTDTTVNGGAISIGAWTHICGIKNTTNIMIYQDSILQQSDPSTGTIGTSNYDIIIGAHPAVNQLWTNSTLDEVKLYNRALSKDEITGIYLYNDPDCPGGSSWVYTPWINQSFNFGYWNQTRTYYDANDCYGSVNVTESRFINYDYANFSYIPKIYEVLEMLPLILLWLGLWSFGYWAMQTRNELLSGTMIFLTVPIDIYLAYKFQEAFIIGTGFIGIAFAVMGAWTFGVFLMIRRTIKVL